MRREPRPDVTTPQGRAARWRAVLDTAKKGFERFHSQGEGVYKRYLDERDAESEEEKHLNLFAANIDTTQSLLYGNTPKVAVSRRFKDSEDDVARVAASMLERVLNGDLEDESDTYADALESALENRLLPGLGCVLLRHVRELEDHGEVEEGEEQLPERVVDERVETVYVHWQDVLYNPEARTWTDITWLAFRSRMRKQALEQRFGEEVARQVQLRTSEDDTDEEETHEDWAWADVWEVWDKDSRTVVWLADGPSEPLEEKDDPYGLRGFFPCPRFLVANTTTQRFMPRPDYVKAQDQYREVDGLTTRISRIKDALLARGVYNSDTPEIAQLLNDTPENALVGVKNWDTFASRGGLKGSLDMMPLEAFASAMEALNAQREVVKTDLYEVTGMSDLMRGQASAAANGPATATESGIKARFASTRMQRLEREFNRFASEAQRIKGELVVLLFEPQRIIEKSNLLFTPDAQLCPQAVELLRSRYADYRVSVKAESLSIQDYVQSRNDRTEILTSLTGLFTALMPLVQQQPAAMPLVLELLKWALSAMRGAAELEALVDPYLAMAKQLASQPPAAQQPPPPDPKLLVQQLKGQQEQEKIKLESQADLELSDREARNKMVVEQNQTQENVREAALKHAVAPAHTPGGMT